MIDLNKIYQGDCLEVLKTFPDGCVNCCVTSPPYYGLRDYGTATWVGGDEKCNHNQLRQPKSGKQTTNAGSGRDRITGESCRWCGAVRQDQQLGLEKTPEEYVSKLVEIFREVNRVLKKDGTVWLNLGDSYWGGKGQSAHGGSDRQRSRFERNESINREYQEIGKYGWTAPKDGKHAIIKPKDLIGIPWMVAFALRADGWYLRQDIIWSKPNPMPESVTDRCTKAHEYIFLLAKSQKYYYDQEAIKQPIKNHSINEYPFSDGSKKDVLIRQRGKWKTPDGWDTSKGSHGTIHREGREKGFKGYMHRGNGDKKLTGHSGNYDLTGNLIGDGKVNKRSVWTIPTMPFTEAHFATFPELLVSDCIKASCPENGTVLDLFIGAGTTGLVAKKLNRNYIGIELNPEYIKIAERRIFNEVGLFQ